MTCEEQMNRRIAAYANDLRAAGVERPWRELWMLVAHVWDCSYDDVVLGRAPVDLMRNLPDSEATAQLDALGALVARRAAHEPLAKILNKASFWKYAFYTTRDTLDPRPESELFVETVLSLYADTAAALTFLDLGTGTGCLLLSCLMEYQNAHGVGVDNSADALLVAQKNSAILGLDTRAKFIQSNWNDKVDGTFDVILCNPPYIKNGERLPCDVLFDPPGALFGGDDGLGAYRDAFAGLRKSVRQNAGQSITGSNVLFEIGQGQADDVIAIAQSHGFKHTSSAIDLGGCVRLLTFVPQHSREVLN
ncbi:MAG: peptide chain release factor N(5)-glutamine methyltransferase [Holosporales bacterium]|jgi:release factor glutamine methyltransferase|nr:peptide chain release factor N(5)-glutamine methyltransferase [Holosporales bacterium]